MGYLKGFSHGMVVGVTIGVLVAPRRGSDTRSAVQLSYLRSRQSAARAVAGARSGWRTAQPALRVVARAADSAGRMVQPVVRTAGGRLAERAGSIEALVSRNGGGA